MASMSPALPSRTAIFHRLAQLELELRNARLELKSLRARDPQTAEVVTRGARLLWEKSRLERELESARLKPSHHN
jgi:hypothetical protein